MSAPFPIHEMVTHSSKGRDRAMNQKLAIGLLTATLAIPGVALVADTMKADTKGEAKANADTKATSDTKGSSDTKGRDVKGTAKNAAAEVKETLSDTAITAKIKADYAKDKAVSAMNIKVETDQKGVVTLSGNAKSKAEADKAVSIAKATKGVTSVKNDITVAAADTSAKSASSSPAPAKSSSK